MCNNAALRANYLSGLNLKMAALKTGVGLGSARRWKAEALESGDDWDRLQSASLMVAGGGLEQAMRRVAAAVVLRVETTLEQLQADEALDPLEAAKVLGGLADSMAKAQASMKRLMPQTDQLAIEISAVKAFAELLIHQYPVKAEQVLATLEAYARGVR